MPENRYAQKGPIHGGDDDSSGSAPADQPTKPDLRRFINKPDVNPRDLFWTIIKAYSENSVDIKDQLKNFTHDRMALFRIGVSIVQHPDRYLSEDILPKTIAQYLFQMAFDAGWQDVFEKLIDDSYNRKDGINMQFLLGVQMVCEKPEYVEKFSEWAGDILLDGYDIEGILAYIAEINNIALTKKMKKELIVLAGEGIDQSQHYALFAIAPLAKEDEQIKNLLIQLLRSWDEETRRISANILKLAVDKNIIDAAKRQVDKETNEEVKKILEEIIKSSG